MPTNLKFSLFCVNAEATAAIAQLNSGLIRIYQGTQPANADASIGASTLLVTLTFNATAAPAPSAGLVTFNAITAGTGVANGTAQWARVVKSDGSLVGWDGAVGTSGSDFNINNTSIVIGGTTTCSSATFRVPQ